MRPRHPAFRWLPSSVCEQSDFVINSAAHQSARCVRSWCRYRRCRRRLSASAWANAYATASNGKADNHQARQLTACSGVARTTDTVAIDRKLPWAHGSPDRDCLGERRDAHDPSAIGPFACGAPVLVEQGLVPIPCGGPDGKRPLLKDWQKLSYGELVKQLPKLIERFGSANVGLACGASEIVVVDCDDPGLRRQLVARFGPTPLAVQTPSGGFHSYYRQSDPPTGCSNLRNAEGWDVDIKGAGGLVICPPSVNPGTGKAYTFGGSGSWDQIAHLPTFEAERLAREGPTPSGGALRLRAGAERVSIGARNDSLFAELLKHAPHCTDFDDLLDVARTHNEFLLAAPLPDSEVISIAKSAWRYEQEGRNWIGKSPRTILTREELMIFAGHKRGGDALLFWAYLESQHARRKVAFALDREAMARERMLPNWTAWRYRCAISALLELELLELVEVGKRRKNKKLAPNKYFLRHPSACFRQNATGTASPMPPKSGSGGRS